MNTFFSNYDNKHLSVYSYMSLVLPKFELDSKHLLSIYNVRKGNGNLILRSNGRNNKIGKINDGEVIILLDCLAEIQFNEVGKLNGLQIFTNENRNKLAITDKNISLGAGDIVNEPIKAKDLELDYLFFRVRNLLSDLAKKKYLVFSSTKEIDDVIEKILSLINRDRTLFHDDYYTQILLFELLLDLNQKYNDISNGNEYINQIRHYIDIHYREKINLKVIANGVGLNSSYMQKIFKNEMGNTVYDYLISYRLNRAIVLMKNTDLPLIDIAIEVGFSNRQSFFNAFKEHMGYTPSQFRKFLSNPIDNTKFT